jgi:nucleoside-diphosphate-sugar epimerase
MKRLEEIFNNKKALVTGGLGFIGSSLCRRLVELFADVRVIDALTPGQGGNRFNVEDIEGSVDVHVLDIRDSNAVRSLVGDRDYIFNLAAYTSHIKSLETPLEDLRINCESHLMFLEMLRETNPSCKILYTGSRCQYGRALYLPIDEGHPFNVTDINGAHKATVEMYHLLYARIFNIRCVCLRLSNVYGLRHQMTHSKQGFLNWFVRVALDGDEIEVFGDGKQCRDFVYVDDAVEAMLQAAAEPACYGDVFNIGSGSPVPIREVAGLISNKTGSGYHFVPFPEDYMSIEAGDLYLDISKFRGATGWEPRVSLAEGLDRTLDFYRANGDKYWDAHNSGIVSPGTGHP